MKQNISWGAWNWRKMKCTSEIIHDRQKLEANTKQMKCKAEATLQTILGIAKDPNLKGIEMEAIWKLLETCVTPILTYGCETWDPNKKEQHTINRIMDSTIKRVLLLPVTTPREALYIESGLLDMKHNMDKKRLGMEERLNKSKNELIKNILKNTAKNSWQNNTNKVHTEYGTNSEMQKTERNRKMLEKFKEIIDREASGKSKIEHLKQGIKEWTPGERQVYLSKLNRNQASTIFKLRTRMMKVKRNYKNAYNNLTCRGCNATEETQEHILEECPGIHSSEASKIHKNNTS